jgi:hypothetical protein
MQGKEKYSPVQIRNPLSKHHLVRLLPAQRLNLVFTKPEFQACSVNISGDFLRLDDVEQVRNGWTAAISQLMNFPPIDASLFLGEVNVFDDNGVISTLCVVSDSPNADYFRAIQPTNNNFRLEPHQVLDVLFYSDSFDERWNCCINGGQLRLEQIDHCVRYPSYLELLTPYAKWPVEEHYFRFRLDTQSIELVQRLPQGHYDGGSLSFIKENGNLQRSTLRIVYNWRDKKSTVYKALLLPRNQGGNKVHHAHFKQRKPKQAMQSEIVLRKIECEEMESGCNVIFAR